MSDKESADEKAVVEEDVAEDVQVKAQKRKKPLNKAAPVKKKSKIEKPVVEKEPESESDTEGEKGPVALLDRSPEITGTRVRKQVERLTLSSPAGFDSPAGKKHELLPGRGVKLGTSPKIQAQLQNVKQSDMTLLHRLLFKRPGTAHEIKKNIREFSGFPFTKDDKDYDSRKHMLEKNTMNDLKFICQILCLEKSGTKELTVERILEFCLNPNPSTKPVAKKAKKSKEKKKTAKKSDDKGRKSPVKNAVSSETVEDSSSSSSSEDESEKEETPAKKTTPKAKSPAIAKETPVKKETAKSKKKSPKKAEIKIKLPPVNKAKKKLAVVENDEFEEEKNTSKEDNSDEENDKKESTEPSDEVLVSTIKQILKGADLEDMTMKNLCKQVYEKFPESDLEKTKKDFIRSTAREILGNGV